MPNALFFSTASGNASIFSAASSDVSFRSDVNIGENDGMKDEHRDHSAKKTTFYRYLLSYFYVHLYNLNARVKTTYICPP
jgi:hypothetical protein